MFFNTLAKPVPFRLSAARQDLFEHPAWQRSRRECLVALGEGDRVLLCGVPGTGKSTLLRDLAETFRAQGSTVVLLQQGEGAVEAGETEIVLVDEADRLSSEQIRVLCLRPNPMVLAGLPGLRAHVSAFVGLIGAVTLDPLSVQDVAALVAARLEASGRAGTMFAPEAISALARRSDGLFRVVVILAGAALFFAELRGADIVLASDIDEAASMREAIAVETLADAAAHGAVPATGSDTTKWPRRALALLVAALAMAGIAVHLSSGGGGSAVAAVETGKGAAAPLTPKRPLSSIKRD